MEIGALLRFPGALFSSAPQRRGEDAGVVVPDASEPVA